MTRWRVPRPADLWGKLLLGSGSGLLVVLLIRGDRSGHTVTLPLAAIAAGLLLGRVFTPGILLAVRRLANLTRRRSGEWCGVPVPVPYLPPEAGAGGQRPEFRARLRWLLSEPATWRDLLWLAVNAVAGWFVLLVPAGLVLGGLIGFIGPVVDRAAIPPPAFPGNTLPVLVAIGVAMTAAGMWLAPWLLHGYGLAARWLLAPAGRAELALRVRHLQQTRTETIDTGAAEMRRIERDLHDGAQARLVALGMTLDAAGQVLDTSPEAARALLLEARDTSVKALAELRDLVRGIHPPVLADRGLVDAVRALALDTPLRTHLASELPGRPPAPVESAAYFAVSELLANVSKHAGAAQAWIDIRHDGGMLRIGVTDDGRGGADPARGSGLRGIERRLAAFDGVLAHRSPPGGPTAVTMEIPCVLSSPKTSSC
ncbi:MAG: sensor domain-containing protein [Streptosporangiaceae bacterium]|nr:sensor domain-containing protein [Streptosporangiaceae bacterium]